ncbi:hypothetical protein PI95_011970 [Hassallia byssoidea VB512170]|uniref:Uncharacterized protein n=1 Tax=Hassallia byssoidea VB512170 TaxID=1304833 RepID=A0A846H9X1_9CYAN|nr:hypothetical protein [Hassalia byssoidea]NEU73261.1 hypothetical protein [Hassalia byssoidea VB512170]
MPNDARCVTVGKADGRCASAGKPLRQQRVGGTTAGATTGLHPPSGSPLRRDGNQHRRVDSPQRTAGPWR